MSADPRYAIGIVDVGLPRSRNLGWAVLAQDQSAALGQGLDAFVGVMADLAPSDRLAIDFEAPLFFGAFVG